MKFGIKKKGRRDGRNGIVHFLLLKAFSLAASILKYSSTSSIRVNYFFFVAPRALFLAGSLQGSEGPSSSEFGLENGFVGLLHLERLLCKAHNLKF